MSGADVSGIGTSDCSKPECPDVESEEPQSDRRAAVFFVGNRLMLDEGLGPAAYDRLLEEYDIPDNIELFDVGCMSLDMLHYVDEYDFILTVDAVDGTGEPAGTVFRFPPDAMARHSGAMASLHDLKLVDLFDAAVLMGYQADGYCVGMQVENMDPPTFIMDLTDTVKAAMPLLVETIVAELAHRGFHLSKRHETSSEADQAEPEPQD